MKYDKIPFANRDIDRITKVSSTATSNGKVNGQKLLMLKPTRWAKLETDAAQ